MDEEAGVEDANRMVVVKEEEQAQEQKATASVHPVVRKLITNPEPHAIQLNAPNAPL